MTNLTIGFSEAKAQFSKVTKKVMEENVSVTVFKRNKPAFMIVPLDSRTEDEKMHAIYLAADERLTYEYQDVFEKLAE